MGFPEINGIGHIDLTVSDADRSARWWEEVLGFRLVDVRDDRGMHRRAVMHPCGAAVIMVTHSNPSSDRFDERAIGLDHFALHVPDRAALEAWAEHLDDLGVAHSGVQEENGGPLIVFRDPDNIQLELYAFDPALRTMSAEAEAD
jgi:catechol 2,3-dioxygenase-like lactoylglutathione lyase family enzyme